jgi:SnoaL-like domain
MPLLSTLERFIACVEHNKHVEAIEEFYTADATMQENNESPRVGRDALVAHEQRAMARTASVTSTCVRPVFQHDEFVVIRWIFEFVGNDGSTARIEELAYQRWEGEHIAQEQFFYDPKQFVAKIIPL